MCACVLQYMLLQHQLGNPQPSTNLFETSIITQFICLLMFSNVLPNPGPTNQPIELKRLDSLYALPFVKGKH